MTTTHDISNEEQAEQLVSRFVRRFEPSYEWLLYYAALPLVLTPELLNYLRNQFLRDKHVPWVAEVDLLLSDVCRPVGNEQYAMDGHIRDYLICRATEQLGQSELERVAKLLIRYVDRLAQTNHYLTMQERRAQQWAAMVFVESERGRVAEDIAAAFQACDDPDEPQAVDQPKALSLADQAEMIRLSRITETLAPQLVGHEALVNYARTVAQALYHPENLPPEQFHQEFQVGDITLTLPDPLKPSQETGFELEPFEFIDVQLIEEGEVPTELPLPTLETEEFTVVTFQIRSSENEPEDSKESLEPFDFEIATVIQDGTEWIIQKEQGSADRFIEMLPGKLPLEMVAVPSGRFMMGSSEDEPERNNNESPQHEVTVNGFFMGRYTVTQAQWKAIAALPQIERELKPNPSRFKGDRFPVEQVSWLDAVEFCKRLSAHTGRDYRLPTEAEWEYACRAGTETPFHFGEMITTDVANYNGNSTYNDGPKGEYLGTTTPVDHFDIANAFGVSGMADNVREWCQDHWHNNYEGAPDDGSAWLTDDENASRVNRGGSWNDNPWYCRSAYRLRLTPDNGRFNLGFRVCCSPPRILQ